MQGEKRKHLREVMRMLVGHDADLLNYPPAKTGENEDCDEENGISDSNNLASVNNKSHKVNKNHGNVNLNVKMSKLNISETNKNDVIKILGAPSTKSEFNDNIWIYIERKKTSSSIFKLGNRKLVKNNILIVELNGFWILKDKKILNIQNMNKISF